MHSGDHFFTSTNETTSTLRPQAALEIAQNVFDHLPAGVWIYHVDGPCLSVNPAARRFFGDDPSDPFNQNFRLSASWQHSGLLVAAEQALAAGAEQSLEVKLTTDAGLTVWLGCRLTTFLVGDQRFLLLTAEDQTARRRMLDQTTRAIFAAATEAVYLLDTQGVIQAINQTNADRLGRSVDELIGCNLYDLLPPPIAASRRENNQQVITSGQPLIYEDQRAGLWLENSVVPVLDETGEVTQLAVFSRNISAHKHSEAVLKKQEENYRNLFDHMIDGCAVHEILLDDTGKPVDYRYLAVNSAFERMTGLKAETLIGRSVKDVLPGIEEFWIEKYGQVALTGEPIHFEDYTGELDRTYEVTAYRPAQNQFAVIAADISVRRRVEEALKTSEQRLNLALETAEMGVWELNLLTGKVWRTLRHAQIFGYDELTADWSFTQFMEHVIPEDRPLAQEKYDQCLINGEMHLVCQILRIDFKVRWIVAHGKVFHDEQGQPVRMLGTIVDITENKQAEFELFNSQQMLRLVMDTMPQRVFWKNRTLRYLGCNQAFAEDCGSASPEGVVGRSDEDMAWHAKARQYHSEDREIMETGNARLNEEHLQHLPDGTRRWLRTSRAPLRDPSGHIFGIMGMYEDITAQKQAETLLQDRTRELMRSNAELEQFANIASHDLQEPLRMVASFAQLLERRYKGQLDQNADEYIHFVTEGAIRMQRLIQDLLSFSRVGTRNLPFVHVSLENVLNDVLDNLQVAIQENSAEITHNTLPDVTGDVIQMGQVFQNLIANALKFRSSQPPRIYISASRQGKEWVISVRDNGIGIAPQYFDRIFIIFQRLHSREQYAGTGIGLAICKKIIERHGGRIWVDSIAGQGATFSFTIPAG